MSDEIKCVDVSCAFNFDGSCAGSFHYGMPVSELHVCPDYKMSITRFIELKQKGVKNLSIYNVSVDLDN